MRNCRLGPPATARVLKEPPPLDAVYCPATGYIKSDAVMAACLAQVPAEPCAGEWRLMPDAAFKGRIASGLCYPDVLALRNSFTAGELLLPTWAPHVRLVTMEALLDGDGGHADGSVSAFLEDLAQAVGLPRLHGNGTWSLRSLGSYQGMNKKNRKQPPKWETWADLARVAPTAFSRVCTRLDKQRERERGYAHSMAALQHACDHVYYATSPTVPAVPVGPPASPAIAATAAALPLPMSDLRRLAGAVAAGSLAIGALWALGCCAMACRRFSSGAATSQRCAGTDGARLPDERAAHPFSLGGSLC